MAIEQHPSKVTSLLHSADWSHLRKLPATKDTEYWLYSISANTGPRFMFNLTKPLLSDIRSGSGKIAEVGQLMSPIDLYVSAIGGFDSASDPVQKVDLSEPMALAMTSFVVGQQSWNSLAQDKTPDEKHVIVLDWETKLGPRAAQACFITPQGKMPDKEALIEISMAIYSQHYGSKPKTLFEA